MIPLSYDWLLLPSTGPPFIRPLSFSALAPSTLPVYVVYDFTSGWVNPAVTSIFLHLPVLATFSDINSTLGKYPRIVQADLCGHGLVVSLRGP